VPLLASFTSGSGKVVDPAFRTARNADADVMWTMQYMPVGSGLGHWGR
jgi:hypothetical protein